jgi:cyclophilin family peptidyl-prolyl cis-trans isomerase
MRTAFVLIGTLLASGVALAQAPASSPAASNLTLETDAGTIVIALKPELAPKHVAHVVKTAKAGGYDGTVFHRVIAGGIIQGGDPLSKDPKNKARYGQGGLGLLKAEFSPDAPFARGVVAAARRPSSNDSGGNQFFIVLGEQPGLKGQYTIWGEVTSGLEVADEIGKTPVEGDRPTTRIVIKKATAE